MFRRSAESRVKPWERPLPVRIAGCVFLIAAALLLLGGAYREQANMISTGLMFLSMGAVFAASVIRDSRILVVAFCGLVILGVFCAVTT